jgi:hypothetical protein
VQDNSLEQIAEGHILLLSDGLEDFQHALFHPDAGLDALNYDRFTILVFVGH